MTYNQGEIYLARLDPATGSEQAGTRPIVIISGDAFNTNDRLVIVAPLTTSLKGYFGSVLLAPTAENGLTTDSEVMMSHVRSLSTVRLKKRLGKCTPAETTQMHYKLHLLLTTS